MVVGLDVLVEDPAFVVVAEMFEHGVLPIGGSGPTGDCVNSRTGYHEFERPLADAIGQDLGQPGTALAPRLVALTAVTGLRELYESDEARALASRPNAVDLLGPGGPRHRVCARRT